tara:strand:+ start:813 stop:1055 length:243 start_codon:yes stop_codon:yes gene_type:complete
MPKYIIKEGMLDKLVSGLFDTIVKGKQARAKEKLKNDPKLKKLYAKLDKSTKELKDYMNKMKKEDPKLGKLSNQMDDFLG